MEKFLDIKVGDKVLVRCSTDIYPHYREEEVVKVTPKLFFVKHTCGGKFYKKDGRSYKTHSIFSVLPYDEAFSKAEETRVATKKAEDDYKKSLVKQITNECNWLSTMPLAKLEKLVAVLNEK